MSNIVFAKKTVITCSAKGTMALAKKTTQKIVKQWSGQGAFVLALQGDLGSGKTTFIQGLAGELGVRDRITSPTFVLMKKFKLPTINYTLNYKIHSVCHSEGVERPKNLSGRDSSLSLRMTRSEAFCNSKNYKFFYHFDCYRLNKPEEILGLGWSEIVANPQNIVAVEWPERIKKFLPKEIMYLNFKFLNKNQRAIKIGKTAVFMVK